MAILCRDYDLLFAHVPKTGGVFVEQILVEHLGGQRIGGRHETFRRLGLKEAPIVRALIVRDPVSWYRSYWAFARQVAKRNSAWPSWDDGTGRHPTAELDRTCGAPSFERFVLRALHQFPHGFVRSMYCNFLNGATHAMRTSHLTEDLEATLRLVCFDRPSLVRDRPRVNETRPRWKDRAVMSEATEQRLREVDNLDGLDFPFVVESCANLSGGQPGRM
jgi:Sulfotransferase family